MFRFVDKAIDKSRKMIKMYTAMPRLEYLYVRFMYSYSSGNR